MAKLTNKQAAIMLVQDVVYQLVAMDVEATRQDATGSAENYRKLHTELSEALRILRQSHKFSSSVTEHKVLGQITKL